MAKIRSIYATFDGVEGLLCKEYMTNAEVEKFNKEYVGIMVATTTDDEE